MNVDESMIEKYRFKKIAFDRSLLSLFLTLSKIAIFMTNKQSKKLKPLVDFTKNPLFLDSIQFNLAIKSEIVTSLMFLRFFASIENLLNKRVIIHGYVGLKR